jgi:hypothetical protein
MTRKAFDDRVARARPGDRITYHAGDMAFDREARADKPETHAVHAIGCAAWEAMEAGLVTLGQRRILPFTFEYIAVKRAPPHNPVKWEGCYAKAIY